ncbi:uncharacterized [Tachysurus ichikawai]
MGAWFDVSAGTSPKKRMGTCGRGLCGEGGGVCHWENPLLSHSNRQGATWRTRRGGTTAPGYSEFRAGRVQHNLGTRGEEESGAGTVSAGYQLHKHIITVYSGRKRALR